MNNIFEYLLFDMLLGESIKTLSFAYEIGESGLAGVGQGILY